MKNDVLHDGHGNVELMWPWRVDQRNEVAYDGEGSEYVVSVSEMFPHEAHPVQVSSLDLPETVEYVNALELRLRHILNRWRSFTRVPEQQRTPIDWIEIAKSMNEAEDFFELNAYAYAHERLREKREKQHGTIS